MRNASLPIKSKSEIQLNKKFCLPSVPKYISLDEKFENVSKEIDEATCRLIKISKMGLGLSNANMNIVFNKKVNNLKKTDKLKFKKMFAIASHGRTKSLHKNNSLSSLVLEEMVMLRELNKLPIEEEKKPVRFEQRKIKKFTERENENDPKLIKKQLKMKQEQIFGIKIKTRSKSINWYKNRNNIKLFLQPQQRQEKGGLFLTSNIITASRKAEEKGNKKFKNRSKSGFIIYKGNSLLDLYMIDYFKKDKTKNKEALKKLDIEREIKIKNLRDKHGKDKYFNPATSNNHSQFTGHIPVYKKILDPIINNSKNELRNLNPIKSRQIRIDTNSNIYTKDKINSQLPYKKLSGSMSTILKTFGNNKFNEREAEFSPSTRPNTRMFSNPNTMNNFNKEKPTLYNQFKLLVGKQNENKKPNNFSIYKKKNYENNILSRCNKTSNICKDFKSDIDNTFYKNPFKIQKPYCNPVDDVTKEIIEDSMKFKTIKRFFVYPKGNTNQKEYFSEDQQNIITVSKQIELMNDGLAFNSRNLIFNKFDTKIEKGEIINFKPDVKKFQDYNDYIRDYKKGRSKNNFCQVEQIVSSIKRGNINLKQKVDSLMRTNKILKD